ncbi:hypothetical protein BU26DRAFT_526053 [Trematosphaeria pertusa]|uniref:Uncharacterized protein n=1 Tax=Trematosphaeria pertusa TaxID=390896 RepID=A0A6A6HQG8_9PLEO|nr:uncharacterized protein BU26DRAFT_526053 [Trematosphaeria pertusa]KAF2240404.1 hypothetical protein BU26DRAFT_526053 [Trematosphaeria pertusa]
MPGCLSVFCGLALVLGLGHAFVAYRPFLIVSIFSHSCPSFHQASRNVTKVSSTS